YAQSTHNYNACSPHSAHVEIRMHSLTTGIVTLRRPTDAQKEHPRETCFSAIIQYMLVIVNGEFHIILANSSDSQTRCSFRGIFVKNSAILAHWMSKGTRTMRFASASSHIQASFAPLHPGSGDHLSGGTEEKHVQQVFTGPAGQR